MMALLRLWKQGLAVLLLAALALSWAAKSKVERQNEALRKELAAARHQMEQERDQMRSATALAKAEDAAHAARIDLSRQQITAEVQNDYIQALGDLRRRYDALRMRQSAAAADSSGGGGAPVPGISDPARGADGAAGEDGLPAPDALIASKQALRLKALQQWVAAQVAIEQ
jgi:hypothetical protein